jgi:hypothetical protein
MNALHAFLFLVVCSQFVAIVFMLSAIRAELRRPTSKDVSESIKNTICEDSALLNSAWDFAAKKLQEQGWIICDSRLTEKTKFRAIKGGDYLWVEDHEKAIRFLRREDAEDFAEGDEDAWAIIPYCDLFPKEVRS